MPSAPGPRTAKGATAGTAKVTRKKKSSHYTASSRVGDTASTTSTATDRSPKGVPAPAAVLMQALGLPLISPISSIGSSEGTTALPQANTSGPSPSSPGMEVEVETKQGYTYTGKLVLLDAHYNVLLYESLVRRSRAFDYERAAREAQDQREAALIARSLQGNALYNVGGTAELAATTHSSQLQDRLPRARYIGTVSLRSNNVVLMRFMESAGSPAANVAESAWGQLKKSFSSMAAAIKAHLQKEKLRKRAARRKRLAAKKA
ncbi:hypothetical protein ABL78_5648 [Leptomonas seymouri]|uniref:Uncharacterized protein n=1 Tax=Leptomonas seymouri TaxID=5684 RepID=A0A0N1HUV2_LEPSE|nr:hypothetical protein ABL78_5648 [Leptomonas seymouri]|eukprot:KPI85281.1 hypothetical protein ABL78_5648 [Leptomonas seymouri]